MAQTSQRQRSAKANADRAPKSSPGRKTRRISEQDERIRERVQDYLDRFTRAMTSGDIKTIAKLWEVPAFVIHTEQARVIQSLEEVERFFSGAKDMYNERGIVDTRAEIQDLDVVSDSLVIVRVRFPYYDENGDEHGEESSSYTLSRGSDGEFKMRVVTMRGESS
jgi:ketosteroid isomerase-like protein